ncbi:hypothetical protein [Paenibacillus rhizovicinus]|uniref:hypothetical protein n=1 Tax=Paenibacillus rhizovicinus TaxID=2704463 RepID=UPI00177AA078|nr:hypothetical protein [Paenibacillus rhizovicinus]
MSEQTSASVQNSIAAADDVNRSVERSAEASRETQSLAAEGQYQLTALEENIGNLSTLGDG